MRVSDIPAFDLGFKIVTQQKPIVVEDRVIHQMPKSQLAKIHKMMNELLIPYANLEGVLELRYELA